MQPRPNPERRAGEPAWFQAAPANPKAPLPPIWEWKVGNSIWLRLPLGFGPGCTIFMLIVALLNGGLASLDLLADEKWPWISSLGLATACLQGAIALASLYARRLQKAKVSDALSD